MIPNSSGFVQALFPSAMWNMSSNTVSLTFDDGPHPRSTPRVFETLQSYGIKGTFFFLGSHVAQYPEIAREASRLGNTIGNHSYDHSLLFFRSGQFVLRQITQGAQQILDATRTTSTLFRPPYGYFRPTLLKTLELTGHKLVMWSLDSQDWRNQPARVVSERIIQRVRPGSIILLHDNENTVDKIVDILKRALDSLLPTFKFSPLSHDR